MKTNCQRHGKKTNSIKSLTIVYYKKHLKTTKVKCSFIKVKNWEAPITSIVVTFFSYTFSVNFVLLVKIIGRLNFVFCILYFQIDGIAASYTVSNFEQHLNKKGKKLKISDINQYDERGIAAKEDQIDALSSSFINSTSAENYLDLRAENALPINCSGKTVEKTSNYMLNYPLHHISEEQVKFKHGCLTEDKESGFSDQEDQNEMLSTLGIVPASAKHCFDNPVQNDSYIHCNGYPETETAVTMRDLLDSVDLSNKYNIDKNFPQSLCNHLLSCNQ